MPYEFKGKLGQLDQDCEELAAQFIDGCGKERLDRGALYPWRQSFGSEALRLRQLFGSDWRVANRLRSASHRMYFW